MARRHPAVVGERALLDGSVRRSPAEVGALLHPGFTEFGASGRVWDRASTIDALAAEDPDDDPHREPLDETLVDLAPGVVLLTYRLAATADAPGSLRSSVWVAGTDGRDRKSVV